MSMHYRFDLIGSLGLPKRLAQYFSYRSVPNAKVAHDLIQRQAESRF